MMKTVGEKVFSVNLDVSVPSWKLSAFPLRSLLLCGALRVFRVDSWIVSSQGSRTMIHESHETHEAHCRFTKENKLNTRSELRQSFSRAIQRFILFTKTESYLLLAKT